MKVSHLTRRYIANKARADENSNIVGYDAYPDQSFIEWLEIELVELLRTGRDLTMFVAGFFLIVWLISIQARSN